MAATDKVLTELYNAVDGVGLGADRKKRAKATLCAALKRARRDHDPFAVPTGGCDGCKNSKRGHFWFCKNRPEQDDQDREERCRSDAHDSLPRPPRRTQRRDA